MIEVAGGLALFVGGLFVLQLLVIGLKLVCGFFNDLYYQAVRRRFQQRSERQAQKL
jgi:hypothetical protein